LRITRFRITAAAVLAIFIAWLLYSPVPEIHAEAVPAGTDASGQTLFWFKGNTHAHSTMTLQDHTHGDAEAAVVAKWYHDHGYHFLGITDHNRHTSAEDVSLPHPVREDFLLLSGMEVTSDHRYPGVIQDGERKLHSTALNTVHPTEWAFEDAVKSEIFTTHAERIGADGGIHIINHPNYKFQVELQDILDAQGVLLMEVANVHPRSNNAGHAGFRPGVEDLWDQVLSSGKLIFGVAADDAHDFAWRKQALRIFGYAPPGGGWVMVRASRLSAEHISRALVAGDFYSTTGVYLKRVSAGPEVYEIELDMEKTRHETGHKWIRDAAPVVVSDDSHFVTEFIGAHGRILHAVHDQTRARIRLDPEYGYVRGRVTYLEKGKDWFDRDRARAFYAWTQPVMTAEIGSAE
jgi:hypothetical protein